MIYTNDIGNVVSSTSRHMTRFGAIRMANKTPKTNTLTGTMTRIAWGRNSASGNPRATVEFQTQDGLVYTLRTSADAACAYGLENPELRELVEIQLERGQIVYVKPATANGVETAR